MTTGYAPFADKTKTGVWRSQFFDRTGLGGPDINQVVDGSVTPVRFCVTAPPNENYYLTRMIGCIKIESRALSPMGYGTGPALTNGIKLWRLSDPLDPNDPDYEWTYQAPVAALADYQKYAFTTVVQQWMNWTVLGWEYNIQKDAAGGTFRLRPGQTLCIEINDDLTDRMIECQVTRVAMVVVPEPYQQNI